MNAEKGRAGGMIRLHPQYGLNPTLAVCYWCGEPTGEIALLWASCRARADVHMIVSDAPCDACKKKIEREGYMAFEAGCGHRGLIRRSVVEVLYGAKLGEKVNRVKLDICPPCGDARKNG